MQNNNIQNTMFPTLSIDEKYRISELEKKLIMKSVVIQKNKRKRLFDVLFSLFVIIGVFSWLYPIIAILIKAGSKGPVLFVQERIGLYGNTFKCYKFRSMKTTWMKDGYTPTIETDRRITRLGHFLRRTNLDELPQFFNVLKGEMSIVGPRPHAISFHKTYASFINCIDNRLLVKPGITGLAQIKGFRGDVKDFEENKFRTKKRICFDVLYIKKWSFGLDMWIIYETVMQMVLRRTNGH